MRWNVVEADQLPKKHVIVLPVDCWGKPLSKMHKALMKKNETLIKGFETDCIEGWARYRVSRSMFLKVILGVSDSRVALLSSHVRHLKRSSG